MHGSNKNKSKRILAGIIAMVMLAVCDTYKEGEYTYVTLRQAEIL